MFDFSKLPQTSNIIEIKNYINYCAYFKLSASNSKSLDSYYEFLKK